MKLEVGRYIIIKHCHWSMDEAKALDIIDINKEEDSVYYKYDTDSDKVRCRDSYDFSLIELVPSTKLLEELL
jgi:hypothetical protein